MSKQLEWVVAPSAPVITGLVEPIMVPHALAYGNKVDYVVDEGGQAAAAEYPALLVTYVDECGDILGMSIEGADFSIDIDVVAI